MNILDKTDLHKSIIDQLISERVPLIKLIFRRTSWSNRFLEEHPDQADHKMVIPDKIDLWKSIPDQIVHTEENPWSNWSLEEISWSPCIQRNIIEPLFWPSWPVAENLRSTGI
jgi:hypothetical protein